VVAAMSVVSWVGSVGGIQVDCGRSAGSESLKVERINVIVNDWVTVVYMRRVQGGSWKPGSVAHDVAQPTVPWWDVRNIQFLCDLIIEYLFFFSGFTLETFLLVSCITFPFRLHDILFKKEIPLSLSLSLFLLQYTALCMHDDLVVRNKDEPCSWLQAPALHSRVQNSISTLSSFSMMQVPETAELEKRLI
jgi:hypothetical protein